MAASFNVEHFYIISIKVYVWVSWNYSVWSSLLWNAFTWNNWSERLCLLEQYSKADGGCESACACACEIVSSHISCVSVFVPSISSFKSTCFDMNFIWVIRYRFNNNIIALSVTGYHFSYFSCPNVIVSLTRRYLCISFFINICNSLGSRLANQCKCFVSLFFSSYFVYSEIENQMKRYVYTVRMKQHTIDN